ncbi:hypothetical protein H0H92_015833 [Tricholoma furcatifolium]|nr:hypothetical protein H0H92_015833 [Tricholoma furcatifolium]
MTVASPGLYREAIRDYNDRFPSEPFEPLPLIPGATIRLRKLKASLSQVKNLGRDDVLRLPAWYSYSFNNRFSITYLRARGPAEVENDPPPPVHLTRMFYAPGKTPRASQTASQQPAASGSSGPRGAIDFKHDFLLYLMPYHLIIS